LKQLLTGLLGAAALCCATLTPALAQSASGNPVISSNNWFPSKWGPADEIGAANYLTPAVALAAAQLVKTGKTYSLGITVNTTTPAYPPRTCALYIVQPGQTGSAEGLGPTKTTYNDDILNCWTGIGTQLDGLGHIGVSDRYYNGNKWGEMATMGGLKKLGADKVPPMVTRGVLLDMAALLGVDVVKEGTAFNTKEIDAALKRQNLQLRQGDVVIFHTGWLSLIEKDAKRYSAAEPGVGREGARYLVSKGVVAVGADTWGVEVIPFEKDGDKDGAVFGVHQILLPMSGTYILENVNTAELAKDKAWEFLFVLGQNKYQGAVQSMINPIAIR